MDCESGFGTRFVRLGCEGLWALGDVPAETDKTHNNLALATQISEAADIVNK